MKLPETETDGFTKVSYQDVSMLVVADQPYRVIASFSIFFYTVALLFMMCFLVATYPLAFAIVAFFGMISFFVLIEVIFIVDKITETDHSEVVDRYFYIGNYPIFRISRTKTVLNPITEIPNEVLLLRQSVVDKTIP